MKWFDRVLYFGLWAYVIFFWVYAIILHTTEGGRCRAACLKQDLEADYNANPEGVGVCHCETTDGRLIKLDQW